jgi:hypothetical protein
MRPTAPAPRHVLKQIDELLVALGSSESNLLTARVLLSEFDLFARNDSAWSEWLDRLRPPLRVWRVSDIKRREPLVDITVTATK